MRWLKQVHTSTYKYIVVCDCFRTVSNQYILVHTGSTGPYCQCTRLARLKAADLLLRKDTPVHTHTHKFIQVWFWLFALQSPLASGGRECRPWAGPLPTLHCKILCPTGISAMLHWCSRSSFCFHLVSRVRTTIVGPAGQHASICQMRHGFSHQQTSKSTTWK